jgi:hypothetical protein
MTGSHSWFDSPPPQQESRWRVFKRGWKLWWEDYWGPVLIASSAALFIWVMVTQVDWDGQGEPGIVNPGVVTKEWNTEMLDGSFVRCIEVDFEEGFDCDWD